MAKLSFSRKLAPTRILASVLIGLSSASMSFISLYTLSQHASHSEAPSANTPALFLTTIIGLLIFITLICWQFFALIRHLRQPHSGARLSLFFATSMLLTAVLPIMVMALFSWQLLNYDSTRSFNPRIKQTMQDALHLTDLSMNLSAQQAILRTNSISALISEQSYGRLIHDIESIRRQVGAIELTVFDERGITVAFAHQDLSILAVNPPSLATLSRLHSQPTYLEFSQTGDGYLMYVYSQLDKLSSENYYLRAAYPMPDTFNELAASVEDNYNAYQRYDAFQPHISTTLTLTLALILALTLLIALWLSTLFGEHMTRPLRQLIHATQQITDGNYRIRVKSIINNDLGALANHFNRMSEALLEAKSTRDVAQAALAAQKTYLEAIMDTISSGVITLDAEMRLHTANRKANALLALSIDAHFGEKPTDNLADIEDSYGELMHALLSDIGSAKQNWQREVTLTRYAQRKVLRCQGSRLVSVNSTQINGYVIIFDDVTDFLHAQRNAAWEEVARRLAHEIKNPLTPIRLQSERLARKLGDKLSDSQSQQLLEKSTNIIIHQVDVMQQMVQEFGQFAKPLNLRSQPTNINQLIEKTSELFVDTQISLDLDHSVAPILVDPIQIEQVLINLTKNAQEAVGNAPIHIRWQTKQLADLLEITIEDNGIGFSDLSKDPFEPYVTTKTKGTGLGLAIVKKIIHEHGGHICAGKSMTLGGASIVFTLPFSPSTHHKNS